MPEMLHKEDSVYQMLFESAGDAILVHSMDKILTANRKACEMLGYTEDELTSIPPSELDDTNHRMYVPGRMAKIKKNSFISFETNYQKKDGKLIPVEITAQSISWNGEPAIMSICRDNTVKKHYDNVLLNAALEWQQTFDAIKDAVFLLSPEQRILRCNKASYRVFNKSKPGEILGKFCWEIVHGTLEQSPTCPIAVMKKSKRRKTTVLQTGDRWLGITVDPVLNDKNEITGAIHIVSDITERKRAEEALRLKNLVFDVSIAANSISDLDGVITEANNTFLQFWGYTSLDEVVGKPILSFLKDPGDASAILTGLNETGKWEGSYTAKRKDGTTFIAYGLATVLKDENGKVMGYQSSVTDITESKQAEEALKISKTRYHDLVNLAVDGILVGSRDGVIIEANECMSTLTGRTREELLGCHISSLFLPDNLAKVPFRFDLLQKGEKVTNERVIIRPDSSEVIVEMHTKMMPDGNYQSIYYDITERKRAEQEKHDLLNSVVEEKNKLSALIDGIADEVWFTDKHGRFTLINPSARREFALTGEEPIEVGKLANSLEVFRPDGSSRSVEEAPPLRALAGEVVKNEGEIIRTPVNGALKYRQVSSSPVRDADGSIIGAVSVVHDITEHKRLEESLKESQKQYRNLVEGTSDLVTRVNADGYLLFVNHAAQEIYGLAPKDCIGRLAFDLIHPEDRESTKAAFQSWLNSDIEIFSHDNRMIDIHGRIRHLTWSIRPERDDRGKIIGFASMARDITERKNMEEEKTKLEEQNRHLQKLESLGRMSGSIAHLFNNQLQVVMGYLEMVIGDMTPGDSRAVKLTTAIQATRKASEVSGLLLAYLGQTPSKLELLDLSELCQKSIPLIMAGKPSGVTFETYLPSPGPCISADAKQTQQILTNLVINAWEAIGDGTGTIRLNVKTVSQKDIPVSHRFPLRWTPHEKKYACLEVTDTGCGIHEEDIDKIFDPFFSTKFTGRGLGLSVVFGIVKAHDSLITVESGINGLTIFRVFFPLSLKIAPAQNEEVAKNPKLVLGDTVLLVEDNEAGREMTKIFLVSLGFKVIQAQDGFEAVEIFKKHKDEISWLFCDLTMPRMGGWDTISALRALRPKLPVVLASGYDEARVMMGDHSELPDLFLHKPYGLNKLRDMVGHPAVAIPKETVR